MIGFYLLIQLIDNSQIMSSVFCVKLINFVT